MKRKITAIILLLVILFSLSGCSGFDKPIGDGEGGEEELPVVPTPDGYTFPTAEDSTVYSVSTAEEASRLIDSAILRHSTKVIIDFSAFGEGFNPLTDFDNHCEFATHAGLKYLQSETNPSILTVEITYYTSSASMTVNRTEENTYYQIQTANGIIERKSAEDEYVRGEDFEMFPIDLSNSGTHPVYNSEELWWALQNNLKPTFPIEDSRAESIYNKARQVLRNIITNDMSDFEKALAIYEYLIDSVAYDYDSLRNRNYITHENTCFYLEGVFDVGLAVCDGKSKAYVLLCGIEGIPCVREVGFGIDEGDTDHAWNYVKIDGVWYLVDTTGGDSANSAEETSLGAFYGKNVEVINYKMFLAPISTYEDRYIYSYLWDEITATDTGASRTSDVATHRTPDFFVDTGEELASLLETAIGDGEFSELALFARIGNSFEGGNPQIAMNSALELLGLSETYEFLIWNMRVGGVQNYLYTLKAKEAVTQ